MEKKAAGDEDGIAEEERGTPPPASSASASTKRKREAVDGASGAVAICDDVLVSILARLPARTAVACTALSRRHRGLIRSPEFRRLHRRLGPPLPRPHVAFVATAPLRWKSEKGLASVFHGFHVAAGAGIPAPMRALFGGRYLDDRYVNTCDGVVLLAAEGYCPRGRCVLWNPAVDDVVRDITVPHPSEDREYLVLGLGYGRRSKSYKLLLSLRDSSRWKTYCGGGGHGGGKLTEYSLQVYTLSLGGQEQQQQPRAVASTGHDGEIDSEESSSSSLYMDGVVFVLDAGKSVILAFDVDDETITTIDLPGERCPDWPRHARSTLMEMGGRLCLATNLGHPLRAGVWLLTADRHWELRCAVELQDDLYYSDDNGNRYNFSIAGVWDCGGVLALFIQGLTAGNNRLCLYQVTAEKMFDAKLPCDLVPECSNYAICWGYKPTLVAPQSIVELSQDEERRRNNARGIMELLKPINDKDSREGRKAALDTISFMELLVSIMRRLPHDLQDVIKLPLLGSEDSDSVSEDESEDSENAARDAFELESVSGSDSDQ